MRQDDKYNSKLNRATCTKKEWFVFVSMFLVYVVGITFSEWIVILLATILMAGFWAHLFCIRDAEPKMSNCICCGYDYLYLYGRSSEVLECPRCGTLTVHKRRQYKILLLGGAWITDVSLNRPNTLGHAKNCLIIFQKEKIEEKEHK